MKFRHVSVVRVPMELVYDWWTSFSEEDGDEIGPLLSRRILLGQERELLIEDEYRYLNRRLVLKGRVRIEPTDSYMVEYNGKMLRLSLKYMFAPLVEGTQLVVLGEVKGKGWLRFLLPLLWPRIKREIVEGIEGNVERVESLFRSDSS